MIDNKETFVLLVAANTQVNKLASMIANETMNGIPIQLWAVGPGAVNQAMKAVAQARNWVDGDLLITPARVEDPAATVGDSRLVYMVFDVFYVENKINLRPAKLNR